VLKAFLSQWAYPIKSDTTAQALDAIGRTILEPWKSDGYEFIHSTGHGVGISDHELGVTIGVNSKLTLRPRLCYSIEPGLYRQDNKGSLRDPYFGVRLEDVVVVTEEKKGVHHHESLGYFPFEKDLIDRSLLNENEQLALESYHRKCPHLEPPS
jgi:Xaa-Pro aminopeptidase